jgi:hypothetical protein
MKKAGFVEVGALGNPVSLDKSRLKLYPLFTEEFLNWLFEKFGGQSPIYTIHLRGVKPVQ